VTVAADPIGLHFGTRDKEVDRTPHVEDVFPGHAFALHEVAEELEALVVPVSLAFVRILTFLKTLCVGTEDDVAFLHERDAGMLRGIAREAGGLAFAEVPFAVVLVPDRDGGGGMLGIDTFGDEEQGGNRLDHPISEAAGGFVGDRLDAVTVLLDRFAEAWMERPTLGPGASETLEKAGAKFVGSHGRGECGGFLR
jgi:hypothetical protein